MVDVTRVIENLSAARELLAKPGGYIKGNLWDNKGGYCALGALMGPKMNFSVVGSCAPEIVALEAAIPSEVRAAMDRGEVKDQCHGTRIKESSPKDYRVVCYNNNTDQPTVVGWFDKAIQMQREHPMENATDA